MQKKASRVATVDTASARTLIAGLPKTEIHLHIEGLVSVDSIWALIRKHKLDLGISSKAQLKQRFQITSLTEFIDLFINIIQACLLSEEDLTYLIEDTRTYLTRNNIRYAEIFFAPTKLIKNGLDFDRIINILDTGANQLRSEGLDVRYIVDVSRGFGLENAMRNLDLTLAHPTENIIGLGLGGAERNGPAREYEAVFKKAAAAGLKVVAHAGEDVGPESIWDTIEVLGAQRIGHGISAIQDKKLMDLLKQRHIPLEICPTSNLFTRKYAQSLQDHPIRTFFDHGMYVTINTDDPTLFGVELNEEYTRLLEAGIFSLAELLQILKNGVFATFLSDQRKAEIWAEIESSITASGFADSAPRS